MLETGPVYQRYQQSLELANKLVLSKKILFPQDVKDYLKKCLAAERMLTTSVDEKEKTRHLTRQRISQTNLQSWDINKTGVFQELLEKVAVAKESDDVGTFRSSLACLETLIDIDFYKNVDDSNLDSRLEFTCLIQNRGIEDTTQKLIIHTLMAAVQYNVMRFHPNLFPEENGRGDFNQRRMNFQKSLNNLINSA